MSNEVKRDDLYTLWRQGYGDSHVRPQDAWDAGWRYSKNAPAQTRLITAVRRLLEWVPVCSIGSSGHLLRVEVEKALEELSEDGPLKSAVGVEADLKHPRKNTGGEVAGCYLATDYTKGRIPLSSLWS